MRFELTSLDLMAVCVGIGLCSLVAPTATAQTPLPSMTVKIQSFPGVDRVVISTTSGKPVASDVVLQVVAQVATYQSLDAIVSKELIIAAGTSTSFAEISLPMRQDSWLSAQVHVEQDDNGTFNSRDLMRTDSSYVAWRSHAIAPQLFVSSNLTSIPTRTLVGANSLQTIHVGQNLGVADPASLPSFKELATFYETLRLFNPGSVTSNLSFLQNANQLFNSIHPSDFFENWTSLSEFQSVLISHSDLQGLAVTRPKLEALRNWVIAGGQLVVFECGDRFSNRDQVLRLVAGKPDHPDNQWQVPGSELTSVDYFATAFRLYTERTINAVEAPDSSAARKLTKFLTTSDFAEQAFIKTDLMNGSVFVIDDDLTDWQEKDWQLLHNALFFPGGSVVKTLGVDSSAGYYQPDFRIPGVGDPPILAFQILIGLFVLLIGPGFYFFFQATGRLYLLLVSTPLFSLAAVLLLFGYGILNDGLGMQGRVLSVTRIDHSMDAAFTHARHVFYSGLAPRDCRFDDQTVVLSSRNNFSPTTRFRYRNEHLYLSGGQIRARSPFQLTSLKCFETNRRLTFSKGTSEDQPGFITNGFANRIKLAVVRTEDGWFLAEDIAPESSGAARKVEFGAVVDAVSGLIRLPAFPDSGRIETRNRNLAINGNNFGTMDIGNSNWGYSDELVAQWSRHHRIDENSIPVNSYRAILDQNEFVTNPQPAAIYGENELHVIDGKW